MRIRNLSLACVLGVGLCASMAQATGTVGLGPNPGGDPFTTTHIFDPNFNEYRIFGGPFSFDVSGGPWVKILNAPQGGFLPGQTYGVHETFTFFPPKDGGPNVPLTDWHERLTFIDTPWDVWVNLTASEFLVNGMPAPGNMPMLSADQTEIWWFFDPVVPGPNGVTFTIWKQFQYLGPTVRFEPITIVEYPTPAPGGAALLALAGLAAARRRR